MAHTVADLLGMTQLQLDDLFKASPAGPIPNGPAKGTAIIAPGTKYSEHIAEVINRFGWQGKVFDAERGQLKNRVLVFGLEAIIAKVYKGPSWLRQRVHRARHSETSLLAHFIRDEIRLIEPDFYLGKVYWRKDRLIDFCLQFNAA